MTTGHCFCGEVTWEYQTGAETWACHCHCADCRRNCAAPITSFIGVPTKTFRWTGAEPGAYVSSPGVTRHFCGRCGTAMANQKGGMLRRCQDEDCRGTAFPRIDPAIIVLVEDRQLHGDGTPRCLLGRAPAWPPGVYSTLAGFVEPGESLEETVAREVREESGIGVEQVRYHASQPWPFPSSLMLGFHATARTLEITTHDDELEDARWFSADELRQAGDWGEDQALCLPRRDSIARHLIEHWLETLD